MGLPLIVIDISAGGLQCEGHETIALHKIIPIEIIGPDGSVLATVNANPVYCRAVRDRVYASGFAFVGPHHFDVQKAIEAVREYLPKT